MRTKIIRSGGVPRLLWMLATILLSLTVLFFTGSNVAYAEESLLEESSGAVSGADDSGEETPGEAGEPSETPGDTQPENGPDDTGPAEGGDEPGTDGEEGNEPLPGPVGLTEQDGNLYFYNEDGSVWTGLKTVETEGETAVYYFQEDGAAFTGGYIALMVDGKTAYYCFQEDGTAFTGGYKVLTMDGKRQYYYFMEDGRAYTDGYLAFEKDGNQYYFFFEEDGKAFTGGLKEVQLNGETYYFYFLSNGQGFHSGYKTVTVNGKRYYYFFGSDGRALTDQMQTIALGSRTAYFLLQDNGAAFTGGYKEIRQGGKTDYYYFLPNGQAFTTGYKVVKIDGATAYFYFESDGKAFTGGLKTVPFGSSSYVYCFQSTGRALTGTLQNLNGKLYYFQENGRGAKSAFVTVGDRKYYFDGTSTAVMDGWFCVGRGAYYAVDGVVQTDTVVEGYELDSTGRSASKYRMIKFPDAKRIYLSPSNQEDNTFITGNANEGEVWNDIAARLFGCLEDYECHFMIADYDMRLEDRVEVAKEWGADVYVAMHSNGYTTPNTVWGVEVYYDANKDDSADRRALATALLNELSSLFTNRGLRAASYLKECRLPEMPSVIVECGYHDTVADANRILNNKDKIAQLYCNAIVSYLGLSKISSDEP